MKRGDSMGILFNPGNDSYAKDRNYKIYIDKTMLLSFLNEAIGTPGNCIAVSHARRFGKSHAAGMIDAYYSLGCDSTQLFEGTKIASDPDYKKYMNKYNVIHLDISSFWDDYKENIIEKIVEYIYGDLQEAFGDFFDSTKKLSFALKFIYKKKKISFVIIIDEWDCIIRNSEDKELVHQYLQFLHSLFKSEESKGFLALAYITGILPIKKIKDESALNNFEEYTMIKSKPITEYYGFTEDEVKALMMLLQNYLDEYSKRADTENIRVKILGDITALSEGMQKSIKRCMERTKDNTGVTFNIALNYGGRDELIKAIKQISAKVKNQEIDIEEISEKLVSDNLYTKGQPDPDLLIRTSGELRLSNFLPWQLVYSEFLFLDKNWPDFLVEDLDKAIIEYKISTSKP